MDIYIYTQIGRVKINLFIIMVFGSSNLQLTKVSNLHYTAAIYTYIYIYIYIYWWGYVHSLIQWGQIIYIYIYIIYKRMKDVRDSFWGKGNDLLLDYNIFLTKVSLYWTWRQYIKYITIVTGLFAHGQFTRGQFGQIGPPKVRLG